MVRNNILIDERINAMNVNKLKQAIIDQIKDIDDVALLKIFSGIIKDIAERQGDVYKFSEKELMEIEEAEAEFERGECFTNDEVRREAKEWLRIE